eukprot:9347000-Alexandrium_andersonii.AAC.1
MHENARTALSLVPRAQPDSCIHLHVYLDGGAEQTGSAGSRCSVGGWAFVVIGALPGGHHACCGARWGSM